MTILNYALNRSFQLLKPLCIQFRRNVPFGCSYVIISVA